MAKGIQEILDMNGIQSEALEKALHQDIREMFLKEICAYMKSSREHYIELRQIYYSTPDDRIAVQKKCDEAVREKAAAGGPGLVRPLHQGQFSEKSGRRKPDEAQRVSLWESQGGRCAVCRRAITRQQSHVDHIIPWDYVGDELENNLQVLCQRCNKQKGNRLAATLHHLFLEKKEVS